MKKAAFCLILGCFVIFLAQPGVAGSKCYVFSNFGDVLKVTVTSQDPSHPANKLLTGVWYYPGSYYMPIIGTLVKDSDGVSKRFSIRATNTTSDFGGYVDCALDATLGTTTPIQGPLLVDCGAGGWTFTDTLVQTKCSEVDPYSAPLPLSEGAMGASE